MAGVGSTTDALGGYNVSVNWLYPSYVTTKGGVNLAQWANYQVVYRVVTDKNTLPKMISVVPDLRTLQVAR